MAKLAGRDVNTNDLGVMGAGVAVFVFSLLPYWGLSGGKGLGGLNVSITAWHGWALLGVLLLIAAAGVVAARVFADVTMPTLPVGWHVVVTAVAALGTLLVIVRGFTYPHASFGGASYGVKWGGYLLFVAAIAETVFAVLALRESGESVSFTRGAADTPPPATT
jgi:hypothetical protein